MRNTLLIILLSSACFARAQTDTVFWFAAPNVSQTGSYYLDSPVYLYLTAVSAAATVTISQPAGGGMPTSTVTIPAHNTLAVDLNLWLNVLQNQPANTVLNYGLKISSTAPITACYYVVGGISCLCNPEDFVLKGKNALGTDFWIPGQDTFNNADGSFYSPNPYSSFDIVATENSTTVTITPAANIVGHSIGIPFTVTLNQGQTYSATAASGLGINHLCGSRVTSDKPIAITEKDDLLHYVAGGVWGDDLMGDQIVPVNVIGTEYIPMYGALTGPPGDMLFITATQNSTTLSLNGSLLTTLSAGQTYRMYCPSPSGYIQTNYPVYVYHLSGVASEVGSALLPPISCTGSASVSFYQSSTINFKVNLLVNNGGQGNFLVNGATGIISASSFTPVPATGSLWYAAQITLPVTAYPLGSVLTISNTTNLFQLGYLSSGPLSPGGGAPGTGASFGYYSNYGAIAVHATAAADSVCAGGSILLFADTAGSGTYMWSGPDGFTSTLQNPVIPAATVPDSGVYTVVVTIPGCSYDTSRITIAVLSSLPVNLGPDTTVCSGVPIILHSSDTYTSPGYLWSTGSTGASITPTTTGTYWLDVTVAGCTGSDTVRVAFNPSPAVDLGNDTSFCAGDSLTLTNLLADGASQLWSSGSTGSSITIHTSGTYWLDVSNDGCTGSDTIHVSVNPIPPVNLGPDTAICQGTTLTLKSSDSYTSPTYLWSTGYTSPEFTATVANAYWLDVTVAGCTGSDTMNLTVNPLPVLHLGNDTAICPTDSITLSPGEPTGTQYLWSTGSNNSTIEASIPGTYKLTVTLNGCSAADSISISDIIVPKINLGPDTTLCAGDMLYLNAGNAASYTWSTGETGQSISITQSGTYWASYKSVCGIVSDTVNADFDFCNLWLPSAFTPNGDGLNDVIRVLGNFQLVKDFSFSIYNRWGQRVFYTDDINEGWDGKFNGVKQDLGTFYYMLFYTLENKSHMMKGDIELIR